MGACNLVRREGKMPLLVNPTFVPFLLFFVGIGVIGGWARRVLKERLGRDLAIDAAGVTLLLAIGAVWGLSYHDGSPAHTVGGTLAPIASILAFLVLGALTLGGASRSAVAWLLYILFAVLLFVALIFALLAWTAFSLPIGWSVA